MLHQASVIVAVGEIDRYYAAPVRRLHYALHAVHLSVCLSPLLIVNSKRDTIQCSDFEVSDMRSNRQSNFEVRRLKSLRREMRKSIWCISSRKVHQFA